MTKMIGGLTLALLSACATPYQHQGMSGGFSETQLDENVFRVNFRGNGYTSAERAIDFTLLRSAELAREHSYHYFIIVQHSGGYSYSTYTTPTQSHTTGTATSYGNTTTVQTQTTTTGGQTHVIAKPSTSNTIVCFAKKPDSYEGMVYNADFIYRSLTQKYGIPAPDAYSYTEPPAPDGPPCSTDGDCEIGKWCGRKDENTGRGACIPIGRR